MTKTLKAMVFAGHVFLVLSSSACATITTTGRIQDIRADNLIEVVYPPDGARLERGVTNLRVQVTSPFQIEKIEVLLDGKVVTVFTRTTDNLGTSKTIDSQIVLTRETHHIAIQVTIFSRAYSKSITITTEPIGVASPIIPPPLSHVAPIQGTASRPVGRMYLVAIGVSDYVNQLIAPLRFADADAEAFAHQMATNAGGKLHPTQMKVLLNRDATLTNVRQALTQFFQGVIAEDVVYIYFSGHGSPEPDNPDNMYFLTYDSDPNNMAVTALPMWDIETFLKRYIKAERVVVIADTCHSGGIGPQFAKRGPGFGQGAGSEVNKYLHALAQSGTGRTIFTASEPSEVSLEDASWGGGHGVFTYFLLEGMKGKADFDHDGIVTLGELADFVDQEVRRATNSRQHPYLTGEINRNLPVAVVGE